MYPGGFAGYTYPQFQIFQEFALDGGVIFDTLANSNESHADVMFIFNMILAFEMKTICVFENQQIVLKYNFENGGTTIQIWHHVCIVEHCVNIFTI